MSSTATTNSGTKLKRAAFNWKNVVAAAKLQRDAELNNRSTNKLVIYFKLVWGKTFHPETKFVRIWNGIQVFIWLFVLLLYPLRIAFYQDDDFPPIYEFIFDCLLHLILLVNIYIQCRIRIIDEGNEISDLETLFEHYKKDRFYTDLILGIPLDIIYTSLCYYDYFMPSKSIYALTRLVKLLFIPSLIRFLNYVNVAVSIYIDPIITRLIFLAFYIFYTAHVIGCGYYFVARVLGFGIDDWVPEAKWEEEDVFSSYLYVFFWSLSKMTGGDTDRGAPDNNIEFVFQMIVLVVGITTYATIIGNASSLIAELNSQDAEKLEKLERINASMRESNVPMHLQERVRAFYEYKLSHGEGINESEILKDLPEQLKVEICVHLYKDLIVKVPFFKSAEETLLHQIVLKLNPRLLTPNEFIFKYGSIGKEMFFISKGSVEILTNDGRLLATLNEGAFFGEYAVLTNERRMASVKTKTFCNLFVLNKEDFEFVCADFPDFMKNIQQIVQERIQRNLANQKLNTTPATTTTATTPATTTTAAPPATTTATPPVTTPPQTTSSPPTTTTTTPQSQPLQSSSSSTTTMTNNTPHPSTSVTTTPPNLTITPPTTTTTTTTTVVSSNTITVDETDNLKNLIGEVKMLRRVVGSVAKLQKESKNTPNSNDSMIMMIKLLVEKSKALKLENNLLKSEMKRIIEQYEQSIMEHIERDALTPLMNTITQLSQKLKKEYKYRRQVMNELLELKNMIHVYVKIIKSTTITTNTCIQLNSEWNEVYLLHGKERKKYRYEFEKIIQTEGIPLNMIESLINKLIQKPMTYLWIAHGETSYQSILDSKYGMLLKSVELLTVNKNILWSDMEWTMIVEESVTYKIFKDMDQLISAISIMKQDQNIWISFTVMKAKLQFFIPSPSSKDWQSLLLKKKTTSTTSPTQESLVTTLQQPCHVSLVLHLNSLQEHFANNHQYLEFGLMAKNTSVLY